MKTIECCGIAGFLFVTLFSLFSVDNNPTYHNELIEDYTSILIVHRVEQCNSFLNVVDVMKHREWRSSLLTAMMDRLNDVNFWTRPKQLERIFRHWIYDFDVFVICKLCESVFSSFKNITRSLNSWICRSFARLISLSHRPSTNWETKRSDFKRPTMNISQLVYLRYVFVQDFGRKHRNICSLVR